MTDSPDEEISQFLDVNTRDDVKVIALQHVLGLSGSRDGIAKLLLNKTILINIIKLLQDKSPHVKKDCLLLLINVSAEKEGALKLLQLNQEFPETPNLIKISVESALDNVNKDADAACMVLCNLTRVEELLELCVNVLIVYIDKIFLAFTLTDYNKSGSKLHYLGPLLSNLSGSLRVRNWFCQNKAPSPIIKILPFCSFQPSIVRRGGAVGTIRNICFNVEIHDWLLSNEVGLLSYLLLPLIGGEDYPDDEMDSFPTELQYMSPDKEREPDPDMRRMLLEALGRLCIRKTGRETLRNNGTYYVLRELHKWEKNKDVLLACENVVDILIRKEEEIALDDITSVEVPHDYEEKFRKMDEEFLNE